MKLLATPTHLQVHVGGELVLDVVPKGTLTAGPRTLQLGAEAGVSSFDNVRVGDPKESAGVVDAGADSSPDSSADSGHDAGTSFCASAPANTLACRDFDEADAGPGIIDTTNFVSPPASCKSGCGANVTSTNESTVVDVDVRLDQATTSTQPVRYFELSVNASAGKCPVGTTPCAAQIFLQIDSSNNLTYSIFNAVEGNQLNVPLTGSLTVGVWRHLRFSLVGSGLGIWLDGVQVGGGSARINQVPGPRFLTLGIDSSVVMSFDNVLITDPSP